MAHKSDIEIARESQVEPIIDIAKKLDIKVDDLEFFGHTKAKISFDEIERSKKNEDGKLILVTAINPTRAGEGKTTTSVGLGEALHLMGKKTAIALREPSFGPVLGVKGGAAGGGYAQVLPMEDINLHFTGDMHAITTANNIVSAILDNHIFQGNELDIDIENVVWRRVLDLTDRCLRKVEVGVKKPNKKGINTAGPRRFDGFDISVASEIMATLCLSENLKDLKEKLSNMLVAYTTKGKPVFVKDLKIQGTLAAVLKDAIKPNLVQTIKGAPAFIHGGPFANIAHGCNSMIATKFGLKKADYVVTEAGFGADLGAEKFLNIKCRKANIKPSAVVIVATIRALKLHGGVDADDLSTENVNALLEGSQNLAKHIDSIQSFNLPYVVAINKFPTDTKAEIDALTKWCNENNHPIALSDVWAKGGEGGKELATEVLAQIEKGNKDFKYTYDESESIVDKINKIAKTIYGADGVEFSEKALEKIKVIEANKWDKMPVCMAKTQSSLSDNAKLIGRPTGFKINVKNIEVRLGSGFIVAFTGAIMTMPGLPKVPSALKIDVDEKGNVDGLF